MRLEAEKHENERQERLKREAGKAARAKKKWLEKIRLEREEWEREQKHRYRRDNALKDGLMKRWDGLLPKDVAKDQVSWERRRTIWRVRQSGMTLRKISDWLGISPERIRQMCDRVERENRHRRHSPAENWMANVDWPALMEKATERPAKRYPPRYSGR